MGLRSLLFIGLFVFFAFGALFSPVLGIMGYMLDYIAGAQRQWWFAPLRPLGIRYSMTLAVMTVIGVILNHSRLKYGKLLLWQEKLGLLMLALIWLLTLLTPETVGRYAVWDHASIKMTKVMIFCLLMTHVVTRFKDLDKVVWVLISGSLMLGLDAYFMPRSAYTKGRLDGKVGGADFGDANHLAIFMVAATVMIGVMFMRSSWRNRLLCAAAGVFSLNTAILCRSRAALLGLCAAGMFLLLTVPKEYRSRLLLAMLVAVAGFLYLADSRFIDRMSKIFEHAGAVAQGEEAEDASAMTRIRIWRGASKMIVNNPFGIGPGNFNSNIGRYAPTAAGKSPHSTYFQAAAELGVLGLALYLTILGNGLWTLRVVMHQSSSLPENQASAFRWTACGLGGVISAFAVYGVFGHLVYLECLWWYLMMPACLQRALDNAWNEHSARNFYLGEVRVAGTRRSSCR